MTQKETIPTAAVVTWLEEQIEDCTGRIEQSVLGDLSREKEAKRAYEKTLKYIRRLAGE